MATQESRLKISLIDQVTSRARGISRAIGGLERQAASFTSPFRSLGGQLLAVGGAYLGVTEGVRATAGAAIAFESAFADVKKVVEASDQQLDNMRRTIRAMSGELPIAANDIAALFAAAGESGIATEDLKTFAEMAARVGIAFDVTAADAGESLAKLKTQLGLSVAETGDLADAINHLSNNMASKAKDVTTYMLAVGALAKMGGFTKEATASIGSAMIAAGAAPEVAATAMQNVVKALTKGDFAKKGQKQVAAALGLDLPKIAKDMQKDAPGALKKVLTAIAKAPKEKHISLLSEFFGDEARAFAPLVGNMKLLDQALDSTRDKAKYAGSAFREYIERSQTTANALQLLSNKISNVFWRIGDGMLPTIKEGATAIGDVLDTLGSRVSIFDKISTGMKGFMQGLGYSGVREVIEDLGDLFLGKIDENAADRLGLIFMKAKEWGVALREFNEAVKANPLAQFFADLAPYGFQIMLWGAGIAFLAGTVRKLAAALMLLSGASTILGALKTVGALSDIVSGGSKLGAPSTTSAKPDAKGVPPVAWWGRAAGWARGAGVAVAPYLMSEAMMSTPGDTFEDQVQNQGKYKDGLRRLLGLLPDENGIRGIDRLLYGSKAGESSSTLQAPVSSQSAIDAAMNARRFGIGGNTTDTLPGKTADDLGVGLTPSMIDALTQPRGTQDVKVVNPQPAPNVSISVTIPVSGATNAEDLANKVSNIVGQKLREAVSGIYADTGYGVA